jgi:protein N-terminal methyltransferase
MGGGSTETRRALDCGAGIGRITKRLLLPIFKEVDMVELNQKFLDQAPQFIGEESSRVKNLFCSGLQDYSPADGHYDVIWCQWVLGHLRDNDLVKFFQRCKKGMTENGLIFVKENVTNEEREFDSEDSSYTRTLNDLKILIEKSGLKILEEKKQKGFPKAIYNVHMFALQ